uniref:DUF4005 domain-containing protein n=1 Tax=Setaria digitata TaxID=48799 RepID=A0A915PQU3_9BILA
MTLQSVFRTQHRSELERKEARTFSRNPDQITAASPQEWVHRRKKCTEMQIRKFIQKDNDSHCAVLHVQKELSVSILNSSNTAKKGEWYSAGQSRQSRQRGSEHSSGSLQCAAIQFRQNWAAVVLLKVQEGQEAEEERNAHPCQQRHRRHPSCVTTAHCSLCPTVAFSLLAMNQKSALHVVPSKNRRNVENNTTTKRLPRDNVKFDSCASSSTLVTYDKSDIYVHQQHKDKHARRTAHYRRFKISHMMTTAQTYQQEVTSQVTADHHQRTE